MSEASTSLIRRLRGRAMGLAVAGTALVLAASIPATAVAGRTRAASADPSPS
ncbi:hypothetical protein OG863_39760 [Streptomyces decoyicus]|uniref:Uncharacterized protein n=1 Tax=Streptomyces decoyicus TaxID=249567 RepID=A0ABZ1FUI0_9ACTN|nr:hypothetical protein [Streptomyces decoyicus]WSB73592.1 hypothetical protein OG863_39760 [Streptomyces decoyicus]